MTTTDAVSIAVTQFEKLEGAWNAADGAAFGAPFADISDFVDIRGEHHHGDAALIGAGHQALFDTMYSGSTVHYHVDMARVVGPGVVVAFVSGTLEAPTGPLEGVTHSTITAVLAEENERWAVTAFHNTVVVPPS